MVDAWLSYAADNSLLSIAKRTADAARESMRLTNRRLQGGVAPRSDVRQAEIVLRTAEADVAEQTTAVAQDLNALQLLTGAPVDPANLSPSIEDAGAHLAEVPAGLDSTESRWLGERIRNISATGTGVLLVDHDVALVLSICDHIYVLDFGKVIAEGDPAAIRADEGVAAAYLGTIHDANTASA